MKIVLATQNAGKVDELREMLTELDIEVLSLLDFPAWEEIEETGATFQENALIKAQVTMERTGLIALADDSGLEVDALGGAPGVYSARYAGEPKDDERNIDKLLEMLERVADDDRTARFRCALAVVTPDGEVFNTEGTVEGKVLRARRGSGGFGYDPVFFVPDFGRTMAELGMAQKNKLSHRAQAFHKVIPILKDLKSRCDD